MKVICQKCKKVKTVLVWYGKHAKYCRCGGELKETENDRV